MFRFFHYLLSIIVLSIIFLVLSKEQVYSSDDPSDLLFKINQFRLINGRFAVKSDPLTCAFSAIRAKEIAVDFSHDGFVNRKNNKTLPYPHYKLATENLARTKRQNAVELWIKSPPHAANLLKDTPFVCVQNYGYYYAYEGLAI